MSKILKQWRQNVDKMNYDLQSWAARVNMDDNDSGTFWQKNKTKLMTLGLFSGMTAIFWWAGLKTLFRIAGIMLILYILTNIYNIVKGWVRKLRKK